MPVVRVEQAEDRPGGAANVALNIASLGAHAALAGLVAGRQQNGRSLGIERKGHTPHAVIDTEAKLLHVGER